MQSRWTFLIVLASLPICAELVTSAVRGANVATGNGGGDTKAQIGARVFHEACTQCHGPSEIVIQRKSDEAWRATVYSMISRGAFVSAEEIDPLVEYLHANYGVDSRPSVASKTTDTPAITHGEEILMRACSACHPVTVVTQAQKSKSAWRETIRRMVDRGAIIAPSEQDELINYITRAPHVGADDPDHR
jgi:mono/diheme cytochrome c family protein